MDPFPHVLLEDYFTKSEWETCMREIERIKLHLMPGENTGSARHPKTGQVTKYNSGMFLGDLGVSEIITMSRQHMYQELFEQIDCEWWRQVWRMNNANQESWLLSRYVEGQYYNTHRDSSQFTMLLWLHHLPKTFSGGDLIFCDFDNYTVPCNNNTGVIFFGPLRHEVPPIKGYGRYTVTCFTGLK
tara:strand:- start:36 stop:593 length:558 start_codon:yes stop_codon:yes gene_type:complete